MSPWQAITSFGDSALLLPLIGWTAICLALTGSRWHEAGRWVLAVGACGGIVCLSKLLFMAWGIGPPGLDYTGFSGHTALAILVWPSFATLISRRASLSVRHAALVAGCALGVAVAVSRLVLKAHSPSEVWLGAILGAAVMTWFVRGLAPPAAMVDRRAARLPLLLAIGALAIGALCYGRVFPSQHVLKDIAMWLSGRHDVFSRHPLQAGP
jgi:membrane-associated phospholipid phosphatase